MIASMILWPTEPAWDHVKAQGTFADVDLLSLLKYDTMGLYIYIIDI